MAKEKVYVERGSDYIPTKEKLWYASAEFYGGGYAALLGLVLLPFLTKSLQISAGIASTIFMLSKVWDAISDPMMGVISDNTRSKWGRRRPYIVLGGVLIPFAFMFMFAPIGSAEMWAKVLSAGIAYVMLCTINTISQVPYCSLSSEISSDFKQRNIANSIKLIFSMAGAAICYLLPSLVLESHVKFLETGSGINSTQFFLIIGLGFGLCFAVPVVLAGIFSKERIPYPEEKSKFSLKNYKEPLQCKSYRNHLIMYVMAFLCMDIISALAVYYVTDVMQGVRILGMPASSIFIIAPLMVMAGAMFPFVQIVMRKKSKQFAYRMGIPFYMAGAIILCFFPRMTEAGAPTWVIPLAAIMMGIGFGGTQMMPWLIFPDTMDIAELKTGKKDTGTYSGLMTFARKLCSAFAIFLVGLSLEFAGYDSTQAVQGLDKTGVFLAIRIIFGVSVTILMSVAIIASFQYKITDKKLARVRYFLEVQRAGKNDTLTETEAMEREALLKELY